jgi:hypothetical protein
VVQEVVSPAAVWSADDEAKQVAIDVPHDERM